MSKLVSCICQWYVVFLLVMGYMSELVSAEVKGVVVTKSGGAVNPYLGTLQRKQLEQMKLDMIKEKYQQGATVGRRDKTLRRGTPRRD
mmetsp:Transcript_9762/g.14108  ORF Transcript_9762/g.14108 Transcript_9762/m.14108 type:complete len:88 (-) Transcript_9762:985-1248(-)